MTKSHTFGFCRQKSELIRMNIIDNRQMLPRWPQILTDRQRVNANLAQISKYCQHFRFRLSQAQHQAAFHPGDTKLRRLLQHVQRLLIVRPGTNLFI